MNEANNIQQLTVSDRLEMCQYNCKRTKGNKNKEEMKIVMEVTDKLQDCCND